MVAVGQYCAGVYTPVMAGRQGSYGRLGDRGGLGWDRRLAAASGAQAGEDLVAGAAP
jgi:hypothetical protein